MRLFFCLATSVAVSSIAYLAAWQGYRDYDFFRYKQYVTMLKLQGLSEEIATYREVKGDFPRKLSDLGKESFGGSRTDDAGRPLDGWGRPFHYSVASESYELFSLGRDEVPGGVGLDADLYAGQINPEARLTLSQFALAPGTVGVQVVSILAGIFAFPLFLLYDRDRASQKVSMAAALFATIATAVFSILAAVVIAMLHLPTGH